MAASFKVEIISNEVIKPSSPSPYPLKHINFSILDQFAAALYVPLLLFYEKDEGDALEAQTERSRRLKTSLAETLNKFHPLAGREKGYNTVNCNDEGVPYFEARINCNLSDFLEEPDVDAQKNFLPIVTESYEASDRPLLLIQANFFRCGGMAVGLRISHKIADASSLSLFIRSWSATALGSDQVLLPHFIGDSLFPGELPMRLPNDMIHRVDSVTKRFVFTAKEIDTLKLKAASKRVEKPTRVEAVAGLIWISAMAASREINSRVSKQSVLSETVNLRKRLSPPLPENTFGNLYGFSLLQTGKEEKEVMELQHIVQLFRDGINEFSIKGIKAYEGDNASFKICEVLVASKMEDVEFYLCSSWNRFQLYEADFGWGKPSWVSVAKQSVLNLFLLLDAEDGEGIEAWVTLTEEHMASFERQEGLLLFATPNPRVP